MFAKIILDLIFLYAYNCAGMPDIKNPTISRIYDGKEVSRHRKPIKMPPKMRRESPFPFF
jgi:hypothetical protein